MSDPKKNPSTFDQDEDLFDFDEVALEFYSSNDEEDLEEIFAAFEAGLQEEEEGEEAADPQPVAAPVADPQPAPAPGAQAPPPPAPAPVPGPVPAPAPPPLAPAPTPAPAPAPVAAAAAPAPTPAAAAPTPQPPPAASTLPPRVHPSPAHHAPTTEAPASDAPSGWSLKLPKWLRGAMPILIAMTMMNAMVALVLLRRPSAPAAPAAPWTRTEHVPKPIHQPLPEIETTELPPVAAPRPERHPTFALANEEISRGEFASARRRIYGLLSIIDRMSTSDRPAIEARAQYLLAEAQHLEALSKLEAQR